MPSAQLSAAEPTPLPTLRVAVLGLILAANNTSIWMIFSFLPFMVHHFFPELPVTELGYEAGILGSAFSAGSLIGNVLWGVVSDRAGRRPTLLCGLMGTALSALAFGFSPTFSMAVFARFMWGLLNGNLGVTKTYLSEISDDSNSAKGMAIFGAIGGIGRTIGPIIGGFLSSPADKYPFFRGTIFETYPYALPSMIVSMNCFIIFGMTYVFIAETLPSTTSTSDSSGVTYTPLRSFEDLDNSSSHNGNAHMQRAVELSVRKPLSRRESLDSEDEAKDSSFLLRRADSEASDAVESPTEDAPHKKKVMFSGIVEVSVIGSSSRAYSKLKNVGADERPLVHEVPFDDIEGGESRPNVHRMIQYSNGAEDEVPNPNASIWGTIRSILHQREVVLTCILYGMNAFAVMIYNEVFPLWVVTPTRHGGFALNSNGIGIIITICGLLSIVLQTTLYPMLAQRMGVLNMFKLGTTMLVATGVLTPIVSTLNVLHSKTVVWVALVLTSLMMTVSSNWAFISVFVLINNSAYRQQRATVNGLGQTFASFGRLCGPYIGATLFAWSENNGLTWPLNYYLVFYLVAGVSMGSFLVVHQLPRTIVRRKREPRNLQDGAAGGRR